MRELTFAQHSRLEGIAREHPDARVVGWHVGRNERLEGPVVCLSDGRRQYVSATGRLGGLALGRGPDDRRAA